MLKNVCPLPLWSLRHSPKPLIVEGQTPPIINSWLRHSEEPMGGLSPRLWLRHCRHCEKNNTQHRGKYVADTISLLYTLMYINITRFAWLHTMTHRYTDYSTIGLHEQN